MRTRRFVQVPRTLLLACRTAGLNVMAVFTLLLVASASAQQGKKTDRITDQSSVGNAIVADNVNDPITELPSKQTQTQTTLPDAPSASKPLSPTSSALTLGDRLGIYSQAIVRPYSVVGPALGAGIGQWEDEPPQRGYGADGYSRRLASGMGRHLISETIRFGVAAADGEDPRYKRSDETGVWNRTQHVIAETFTSQTASGSRVPAYSRFVGIYGAAFVSNLWYPDSRATTGYAMRRGSTALGASLGFHLFEEFIPS